MTQRHFCFAVLGLVFSASITGCPIKDAAFEPLVEVPQVSCISVADCDDGNACTTDSCDEKTALCVVSSLDGVPTPMAPPMGCVQQVCKMGVDTAVPVAAGTAASTQIPGDCKRVVCDGMGGEMTVNDDDDVKNDGLECTSDICTNGVPTNPSVPVDTPCGTNMALACNANGQCQGCTADSDCSGSATACASTVCTAEGLCDVRFEPNGTPLPAPDQTAANCKLRVCDGAGTVIDIADPNDPLDDNNECTIDTCNGMAPAHSPAQAGVTCNGNSSCNGAGQCLGALGSSCASAGECSSGRCIDGVCCESACSGECMSCNMAGSAGTCAHIPFPGTDTTCDGTRVCNGNGSCELENGESCNPGKKCASGTCDGGKCKSTAGQPCDDNAHCVNGICSNGVCM